MNLRFETRPRTSPLSSNGFELTGAGLTPNQNNDNWAAGVRCSEGLDDAFIC